MQLETMSCAETTELIGSAAFRIAIGLQAVTAFLSAITSVIVLRKCKNLHFHVNCKILMMSMLFLYIVHSVFLTTIQTIQLIVYIASDDPCKISFPAVMCFCFRLPTTVCLLSFAALQFAIIIERVVALCKRRKYDEYGSEIGIILTAICVLASVAATAWAASAEDFKSGSPYCAAATPKTADRVTLLCFVICIVTLLTPIAIIALFTFNKIASKRKIFDLQSSYQIRENATVIRIMLPLSIFQTACYVFFSVSNAIISIFRERLSFVMYRTLWSSAYIIPFYTLISPVLIFFIIKWSQQLKKTKLRQLMKHKDSEKDTYFQTYTRMWSISLTDIR